MKTNEILPAEHRLAGGAHCLQEPDTVLAVTVAKEMDSEAGFRVRAGLEETRLVHGVLWGKQEVGKLGHFSLVGVSKTGGEEMGGRGWREEDSSLKERERKITKGRWAKEKKKKEREVERGGGGGGGEGPGR